MTEHNMRDYTALKQHLAFKFGKFVSADVWDKTL